MSHSFIFSDDTLPAGCLPAPRSSGGGQAPAGFAGYGVGANLELSPPFIYDADGTNPAGDIRTQSFLPAGAVPDSGAPNANYPAGTYDFHANVYVRGAEPTINSNIIDAQFRGKIAELFGASMTVDRSSILRSPVRGAIPVRSTPVSGQPVTAGEQPTFHITVSGRVTSRAMFETVKFQQAISRTLGHQGNVSWRPIPMPSGFSTSNVQIPTDGGSLWDVFKAPGACTGGSHFVATVPWLRACVRFGSVEIVRPPAPPTQTTPPSPTAPARPAMAWPPIGSEASLGRAGVMTYQRALIALDWDVGPSGADGLLGGSGSATRRTLTNFQRASNIRVDGQLGPETQRTIQTQYGSARSSTRPPAPGQPPAPGAPPPAPGQPGVCAVTIAENAFLRSRPTFSQEGPRLPPGTQLFIRSRTNATSGNLSLYAVRVGAGSPQAGQEGFVALVAADVANQSPANCLPSIDIDSSIVAVPGGSGGRTPAVRPDRPATPSGDDRIPAGPRQEGAISGKVSTPVIVGGVLVAGALATGIAYAVAKSRQKKDKHGKGAKVTDDKHGNVRVDFGK